MNKIKLIVDSCSSIPKDIAKENNIDVLPVEFSINDELINPIDSKLTVDEFFDKLTKKVDMKTSAIAPNLYFETFEKYVKEDYQVIYVSLSSGLSCGYNNALLAKNMILEEYPNAKVECIDSLSGSIGIYFTIREVLKLIKDGLNVLEIKSKLDKNGLNIESLFTIGSLYHLYKGGRLRLATAAAGVLLRIKPLVIADKFGKLKSAAVHIGKKKALAAMADRIVENVLDNEIFIGYTNNLEEAEYFEKLLLEKNNNLKITKYLIDFTMMCHCGPETVAVFYKKKNEIE
jgi:DegV family protein with EDD domain